MFDGHTSVDIMSAHDPARLIVLGTNRRRGYL